MPVLFVYGVPDKDIGLLEEFTSNIISTVANNIEELNLSEADVSCFFPKDKLQKRLGEEIIIFVDGLFEKPERTEEVRNRLAGEIVETTHEFYPEVNLIECFIRPFNPTQGFKAYKK